jgi:hypothetical protein
MSHSIAWPPTVGGEPVVVLEPMDLRVNNTEESILQY